VHFEYQGIDEMQFFDIANINYPFILGTDWMFEHLVTIGFNVARVVVGSHKRLPFEGLSTSQIASSSVDVAKELEQSHNESEESCKELDEIRKELRAYAQPPCCTVGETDLPPLRAINHRILLVNEGLVIPGNHQG
jgi:hypothetical protein